MALFDRTNRDREGRWGGSPEYGGGQGRGFRGMWNRVENGIRDAFDAGGYDRDYGARGHWQGRGTGAYDRPDYRHQANMGYHGVEPSGWGTGRNRGAYDVDYYQTGDREGRAWSAGYDRDYNVRRGMELGRGGVDEDRHLAGGMRGGRDRMETDAGDPFGDRQSRTPFRVMRGRDIREGLGDRGGRMRSDVWRDTDDDDWSGTYRGDTYRRDVYQDDTYRRGLTRDDTFQRGLHRGDAGRGWNQGIGDDPYYNRSDFQGAYDRDYRGRERGGGWF
jgi:hypothetical protein